MNRRFYCDERTVVETVEGRVMGCFLNDHYYFRVIPYATAEKYSTILWDNEGTVVRTNHDLALRDLLPKLMLPNDSSAYANG